MPRGDNPNSRKNLKKFGSEKEPREAGKKGGKKSGESRRFMSNARNALKELSTDDELLKISQQLMDRGKQGNLTAIKMIFDYTEDKAETNDNEIKLIISEDNFDEWSV